MIQKTHLKNMSVRILSIFLFLMIGVAAIAQNHPVSGSVLDEQGFPLPGVNIKIKGTNEGTISDFDGNFTLSTSEKSVLIFSYIGYVNQEVTIGKNKKLNVVLKENQQALDEVVVVGYGVQKKSHLTGSVSKLNSENLTDVPVSRVDQVLQGKIAGVNIQNTTSEAGVAPAIRVRGMGSISAESAPLVVIDGYPTPDGLSTIDMGDVESIEVLKDAASSAIYGSRAANGVILVTTKSGSFTKPKYSVKASTGVRWAYKLHPILSSQDYLKMVQYENPLRGVTTPTTEEAYGYINNYTDWQREGLQDTPQIHNVQLSVSGGKKEVTYYISGGFVQEDGIMINSGFKRVNVRSRINAQLSDRIEVGVNMAPSFSSTERPATNFIDFYRTPSWLPVKHTEETSAMTGRPVGSYAHGADFNNLVFTRPDGTSFTASPFQTANHNPRSLMDNETRSQDDYNMQGNGYVNFTLAKGLTFRTSNGFYVRYRQGNQYRNYGAKKDGEAAQGIYTNRLYVDLLSENTLNYIGSKGKHDYSALLGYTAQTTKEETAAILGLGFPTDYIHTINAATEIDLEGTNTLKFKTAMMSFLSRLNYSYGDRYLASVSIRTDGSSLFADGNRWGWFPSASAGWRISEEGFLKDITWISQLKLRGSVGVTGNNNIPANSYYDLLYANNYVFGSGNGDLISGLAKTSETKGNKEITWEQTNEYNVGIDFSVLNNRINLSGEWYYSTTKQLLFKQPTLSFIGHNNYWNNIGRVRNTGVEFELNTYNIRTKNFEWNTSVNLSHNANKLLQLSGEERLISRGEREEAYLAQVGKSAIAFYGYKTCGVWKSQTEIDANPHLPEDVPGGLRVVDIDNNGVINDKDRTVIGNPFPKISWGMTNTFKYKNFDLYVLIQGVNGVDVYNGDGYYNETKRFNRNYVKDRYISEAFPGDGKTPYFTNGVSWQQTDYMIEDGSYVALRDVVIGYKFTKKQLRKLGMKSLRLYASGQNLLHFSSKHYRGINPEARMTSSQYSSPLVDGYQRGGFPLQSTFSAGIELNF